MVERTYQRARLVDRTSFDDEARAQRAAGYGLRHPAPRDSEPDDDIPLFISDEHAEPQAEDYIQPLRMRRTSSLASRILAVVGAASAVAVLFAFLSSDATRAFVQASVAGTISSPFTATSSSAATPPAVKTAAIRTTSVPIPATEPKAAIAPAVAVANVAPLRDAMNEMYQPRATPPVAVESPTPPAVPLHRLAPDDITASLNRADALIRSGDLAAARLVLRRAADDGDGQAAIKLAETYDPEFVGRMGVHGITGDVAIARDWYEKARKFGAADAAQRLERLASTAR
jgi:hypothetical protein